MGANQVDVEDIFPDYVEDANTGISKRKKRWNADEAQIHVLFTAKFYAGEMLTDFNDFSQFEKAYWYLRAYRRELISALEPTSGARKKINDAFKKLTIAREHYNTQVQHYLDKEIDVPEEIRYKYYEMLEDFYILLSDFTKEQEIIYSEVRKEIDEEEEDEI